MPRWVPVVTVGGVDVSARVVGSITWRAERDAARLASVELMPTGGTVDPSSWQNAAVNIAVDWTADPSAPGQPPPAPVRLQRFAGWVRLPRWQPGSRSVILECSDRLPDQMRTVAAAGGVAAVQAILTGTRWHDAVHGEPGDGWDVAERLLETVPWSFSLDHGGLPRWRAWAAKGTADFARAAVAGHTLADRAIVVELADEASRINDCRVSFAARGGARHHQEIVVAWASDPEVAVCGQSGYGAYVQQPWWLPSRAMVTELAAGLGGTVPMRSAGGVGAAGIAFEGLPASGSYNCSGNQIAWNVVTSEDRGDDRVTSFSYTAGRGWGQRVEWAWNITVAAPASITAFGGAIKTDSASIDASSAPDAWDRYDHSIRPAGAGWTGGGNGHWYAVDMDAASIAGAIECVVAIQYADILRAHRQNTVEWAELPGDVAGIDIGDTVALAAQGVTALGTVAALSERWDLDSGDAETTITIDISLCPGATGVSDPITAPSPPTFARPYTLESAVYGGTYIGGQPGAPEQSDAWRGWITNRQDVWPDTEVYAPERGRLVFEIADVPAAARDLLREESAASYVVVPPHELLELAA